MRNAVSVESNRNAILFDAPPDKLSAENITQQTKKQYVLGSSYEGTLEKKKNYVWLFYIKKLLWVYCSWYKRVSSEGVWKLRVNLYYKLSPISLKK